MSKGFSPRATFPGRVRELRAPAGKVTQVDLVEEIFLSTEYRRAMRALRKKRAEIRAAYEAGAAVEPGVHEVRIEVRRRRGKDGRVIEYSVFVVE